MVRAEPGLYGSVASDPTLSRTITRERDKSDPGLAGVVDRVEADCSLRWDPSCGTHWAVAYWDLARCCGVRDRISMTVPFVLVVPVSR